MRLGLGALAAAMTIGLVAEAGAISGTAVDGFVAELVDRHALDARALRRLLADARIDPAILRAMTRPATARPWHEFRPRYVNAQRIDLGVRFWQEHAAVLSRAQREYGVPEEVLVAVIGIETLYGRALGRNRILDALVTLAFAYPPRAEFFRGELEQYVLLAMEAGIDPSVRRGSFAGAMGIAQFLPSSYRRYAVDFDGDGRRDLWAVGDAIGSIANYLRAYGWETGAPVAVPAQVDGEDHRALVERGLKPELTVAELRGRGVAPAAPLADELPASLFEVAAPDGPRFWLGLNNFYVITRYNRSVNYALAVYELAQALQQARAGAPGVAGATQQ